MKKGDFLAILLIAVLGAAIYANCLNNQFVYDDEFLIEKNSLIKSPSFQTQLLTKNIRFGVGKQTNVYRPLQMLSYKLDYYFWGLNPTGYHISNIALHIFVALSLYFLLRLLFQDRLLSFMTSLLFVSHPVHTEAITYISGRTDPLGALFLILAFYFYVQHRTSSKTVHYILSLFLYALALFSRETTLIFLLILIIYDYIFTKKLQGQLKKYIPFIALSLLYLFLRIKILAIPTATEQYVQTSLMQRLPGIFSSLTDYFRILIFPVGLHMEYIMHLCPLFSLKTISGIIIVALSIIIALKLRKRRPLISFSILWFFVNFIPVSNIFALNAFMAEHWLYLASIGFFLIIGYAITTLLGKSKPLKLIAALLLASLLSFYSALTITQNRFWRDPITLYERILKFSPRSSRIHNSLGAAYFYQGDYDRAEDEFKKAVEIKPSYADAYNNLGGAYTKKGLFLQAKKAYKKAIELYRQQGKHKPAGRIEQFLKTFP